MQVQEQIPQELQEALQLKEKFIQNRKKEVYSGDVSIFEKTLDYSHISEPLIQAICIKRKLRFMNQTRPILMPRPEKHYTDEELEKKLCLIADFFEILTPQLKSTPQSLEGLEKISREEAILINEQLIRQEAFLTDCEKLIQDLHPRKCKSKRKYK